MPWTNVREGIIAQLFKNSHPPIGETPHTGEDLAAPSQTGRKAVYNYSTFDILDGPTCPPYCATA